MHAEEVCACLGTVVLSLASSQGLELSPNRSSRKLLFILQNLVPLGPGELPCSVSMATARPWLPFRGDLVSPSSVRAKRCREGGAEVSFLNLLSQPAHSF